MGTPGSSTQPREEALSVFRGTEPGTPLTTSEVAEELDCARRTAYDKLAALADDGELETKKVGARGRIWWRSVDRQSTVEAATDLERAQFHELVEAVADYAIFVLDRDGHVRTWNRGARQIKGYDEGDIVGEHFSVFYTDEDREAGRPEENLRTAAEEGRTEDEGLRVQKNGETFWANVVITALFDDDGDLRGFAKVTRDMTERHEYEEQLRDQRDELDELDQINEVIRDIDQALVAATTREEIEQAVCDRLATSKTYTAAWTAEYTDDFEELTPRTWAGIDEEYLDAIRTADATGSADMETDVGAIALKTRTSQPVQLLGDDETGGTRHERALAEGFESAITVPLVHDDVEYGILTVYADHESAFDRREIAVMGELGETISHAIAAIRRKERERTVTALQESTRELLRTASPEGIGDIIVETLTSDLALEDAIVYYFDTTENTLEPVSSSFQSESYADRLAPLAAGTDSPIWTSFMEGEPRSSESVLPAREIGHRRTLVVPLGDHGVLATATGDGESFDADSRNLVALVAATAEAAFERVESQMNLRERDELLQEQNQRLQRLNQINSIIREVDQGLVRATTREEVQQTVCDRLTRGDRFRFAWIATSGDIDGGLKPAAWSGDGRGYLDSIDWTDGAGREEPEPTVVTARTGDVTVISNVAEDLRGGRWRKEAFSREFQSVISVPLSYGDFTYGTVTVYADRPSVFEEMERAVFSELGETIANAINAVDTKQALLGDQVIELEFRLGDEPKSVLARFAEQIGREVALEGAIPLSTGNARLFFFVRDASPDEIEGVLERSVAVDSHRVIAGRDDGHLVETVVSGPTIAVSLLEQGVSLRTLEVTTDGIRVIVDLPSSADVRGFVDRFRANYESATFVARRERDRPVRTSGNLLAELEDDLTDRQLEVLKTAYYGGFFTSPRESTGGDIAEVLGVSQPTVTEQLRAAQRKVLDVLLADGGIGT